MPVCSTPLRRGGGAERWGARASLESACQRCWSAWPTPRRRGSAFMSAGRGGGLPSVLRPHDGGHCRLRGRRDRLNGWQTALWKASAAAWDSEAQPWRTRRRANVNYEHGRYSQPKQAERLRKLNMRWRLLPPPNWPRLDERKAESNG